MLQVFQRKYEKYLPLQVMYALDRRKGHKYGRVTNNTMLVYEFKQKDNN